MAQNLVTGKSTSGGTVTVYWYGTTTKPTINKKDGATAQSNPMTAAADGSYAFWVDDGHYTVENGTPTGNRELRLKQATAPAGIIHAKDIHVDPFRSSTATDLETLLETLQNSPATPGDATFAGQVTVAGKINAAGTIVEYTANGSTCVHGIASELLTLSTIGTTTDTTANLLPANSIIDAVCATVTTTITTATDWKLGDPTSAGRFSAVNSTMTAGSSSVGLLHMAGDVATVALGPTQAAAAKVRVTTTGTPGAGAVRITVYYRTFVAPTS